MFEKATRLKIRYNTTKGLLTVEELWDLPLTSSNNRLNLDDIARDLHKQLKNGDDVSFVMKERKSDPVVQLKFDIVKHVIEVKLAENEAAASERANSERKQKLLAIISDREDEDLRKMPLDELRKAVSSI